MTCIWGNDGVIKVGANPVGKVVSFEVEETVETLDCTTMGDDWNVHRAARKSWTASVTLRWQRNDAGQNALTVGSTVAVKLYPEGDATGSAQISGNAIVTKVGVAVNKDDLVERTVELTGSGPLTHNTVV